MTMMPGPVEQASGESIEEIEQTGLAAALSGKVVLLPRPTAGPAPSSIQTVAKLWAKLGLVGSGDPLVADRRTMGPSCDMSAPSKEAHGQVWTSVIEPPRGNFDWRLTELLASRDLIRLFVWRDFIALYKQTILGPLWHVVQPVLTTLTYTLVFGLMVRIPTGESPPFLFYLTGNVLWSFFSLCLTKTSSTFLANTALLGKVYFHRLVIPVSMVLSAGLALGIQAIVLLVAWVSFLAGGANVHPTGWLLAVPLAVALLGAYALGGGILVAALTTRYRDLGLLVAFGTQLLMFATPVLYPITVVPERLRWLVWLNPLSAPIELIRAGLLGAGTVAPVPIVASCFLLPLVLLLALALFSRVDRTFMDTI